MGGLETGGFRFTLRQDCVTSNLQPPTSNRPVLELPRVAGDLSRALPAVLEVELLEVGEDADGKAQLLNSLPRLHLDQLRAGDELACLGGRRS